MHSNGGRDVVSEISSPTVGESRRGRVPMALSRRRLGATSLIAGGSDESLRFVLPMRFLRTMTKSLRVYRFPLVAAVVALKIDLILSIVTEEFPLNRGQKVLMKVQMKIVDHCILC
jgi:hypothetical protein